MNRVSELIGDLPETKPHVGLGGDEVIAKELTHQVLIANPFDLAGRPDAPRRLNLETLLQSLVQQLRVLSDEITARYLIHTSTIQSLTGRRKTST